MLSPRTIGTLFVALSLIACGDGGGADAGTDAHAPGSESCQRIVDACHEVDPGTGPIHDCHETAHDVGTDEACAPIETSCVAMCVAAAADGGVVDDDGGAVDGGDAPDAS